MTQHNKIIWRCLLILVVASFLSGCAGMMAKPTEQTFKAPIVTLDSMEVTHFWGYWFFASTVTPTKGAAGNYGAPLALAFIFNVENPNDFPVMTDSLKFSVSFEEFELNSLSAMETVWIPPGKTNQIRVPAIFDVQLARLNLMLASAMKLQERKVDALTQLEKWWTGVSQFAFPIHVTDGVAVFKADNLTKVSSFKATYPPK